MTHFEMYHVNNSTNWLSQGYNEFNKTVKNAGAAVFTLFTIARAGIKWIESEL